MNKRIREKKAKQQQRSEFNAECARITAKIKALLKPSAKAEGFSPAPRN